MTKPKGEHERLSCFPRCLWLKEVVPPDLDGGGTEITNLVAKYLVAKD